MAGNEVRITVTSRDRSKAGFQSARKNADQLGNSTKRIGEIASGILAAGIFQRIASAATRAFTDTIRSASNLQESINATQVTFGSAADSVLAIGENAAQSMGLSQRAFNEAAVRFSAFAEQIAGRGGDVAGTVEEVTRRASDFASVMNIDVAQAMQLFQSGLAGESEPLRRYGIDISAAAVETEAYASGIAEAGSELTEAEKIQARYNLIMQQTAETAGDFQATSGDLANAQRIFNAEVENAQAAFGETLLPLLATATGLALDMVVGFQALPGPLQAVVGVLGAAAALAPGVAALAAAATALGVSLRGLLLATGPAGAVLLGLGAALAIVGKQSGEAEQQQQGLIDIMRRVADAAEDERRELVATELVQSDAADAARELGIPLGDLVDIFLGNAEGADRLRERLQGLAGEQEAVAGPTGTTTIRFTDQATAAQELLGWLGDVAGASDTVAREQREVEAAAEDAEEGMLDLEEALSRAEQASKDADEALAGLKETLFGTAREALNLEEREDALTEAVKRAKEVSEDDEASKLDQRDAMRAVADQGLSLIETLIDQGASTEDVRDATERARRKFLDAAEAMGIGEGKAKDLADKYGLIPDDVATEVDILNYFRTQARIAGLAAQWAQIQDKNVTVTVNTIGGFNPGAVSFGRATGGIAGVEQQAQAGGPRSNRVLVGELGPEVVEMAPGSRVIPSVDQATDRGQLGSSGAQHVVVELVLEGAEDAFVEALRKALRVRGESLAVAS